MAARQKFEAPPATSGEQRLCARGTWCAAQTRDVEGTWHPARTYQAFCSTDELVISAKAADLSGAYVRLASRIGDPVRSGRAIVRRPPGSRVLIDAEYDALLRLISAMTGGWAARTRAIPGLSLTRHTHRNGTAEAVAADCSVLARHTVPLLALAEGPMARTWTWRAGDLMPPDLEEEIGGLEIIHIGDGWVKAMTELDGTAAGHDILDLHRHAVKLLGETAAPPTLLDGIPCRNCEAMSSLAVLEQPPPDPQLPPGPWVRCLECRDEMTRKELDAWTAQYAGWVRGAGVLTCRRCDLGRCPECSWASCDCRKAGHRTG